MKLRPISLTLIWRVTRTGWSMTVRVNFNRKAKRWAGLQPRSPLQQYTPLHLDFQSIRVSGKRCTAAILRRHEATSAERITAACS